MRRQGTRRRKWKGLHGWKEWLMGWWERWSSAIQWCGGKLHAALSPAHQLLFYSPRCQLTKYCNRQDFHFKCFCSPFSTRALVLIKLWLVRETHLATSKKSFSRVGSCATRSTSCLGLGRGREDDNASTGIKYNMLSFFDYTWIDSVWWHSHRLAVNALVPFQVSKTLFDLESEFYCNCKQA